MSDIKPKRGAREPARSAATVDDVITAATASVIEQNMNSAQEVEPVSTTALVQAAPAGPAWPVPAAPESTPSDNAPAAMENAAPSNAAVENAWSAVAEAQTALARGFERAAVEATGIGRSGMAATADAAVALLGARTFAEAIEINAGLARRGVDAMLEGSAKLSEIGAQALADASKPLLARFGLN
jgi:hypothetical protein